MKNPVTAAGAVMIIFSMLFAEAVQYSPNRVLAGTSYSFFDFFRAEFFGGASALLLALAIVLLAGSFFQYRFSSHITVLISMLIGMLLLFFTSSAILRPVFNQFELGRISLGGGFWLFLAGVATCAWGTREYRRAAIAALLMTLAFFVVSGFFNPLSIMKEYFNRSETFAGHILRHILLSTLSVLTAMLIGIPTGVYIFKSGKPNRPILFILNLGQTVPTLSLLGLLIVPLGVGVLPAFIILVLYAMFPIVHNTLSGLRLVNPRVTEAAGGVGMKGSQIFWKVQIPLSLPVILGGVRTALTQSVGNTILAGLIGGGGLGSIIFLGLAQSAPDLIMLGIIPLVAMAFILDVLVMALINAYKRVSFGRGRKTTAAEMGA